MTAEPTEEDAKLLLPARLLEEALAQDDQQLCLDEICAPNAGSADYDLQSQQLHVEHVAAGLPAALTGPAPTLSNSPTESSFTRQGSLPEIRHMWRSFDSKLVLWKYADPRAPEVTEYHGVTQQILAVATAKPKGFVSGVAHFLVVSTPVEVSLHSLRFAPGSDRLLPPTRTPFTVATDDTLVGAIASDAGRIFLGGNDGCIHEFQYFDDETRWCGRRAKRGRKSIVSWTVQSRLPTTLRRASEAIFGPAEAVQQLSVDGERGLLFSLSSGSSVAVFRIPPSQGSREPPLAHVCSLYAHSLAASVTRIRSQLFPGLAAPGSLGAAVLEVGMAAIGACHHPRLVKLLPVGRPQGGSIVLCAVAEDGTRVFLRGNYRSQQGPGARPSAPTLVSLAVHHVRFLDVSCPGLYVRDALEADGVTLLLARLKPEAGLKRLSWSAEGDVVVAISADLRAVAQRQSRGRSPWLSAPTGLAEHAGMLPLEPGEVIALAALPGRLPQQLQALYSGPGGALSPVLGLSELARQQLLPPTRFVLVSNLGVHALTKLQPLELLRSRLLRGELPQLRDFALHFTPEQSCALCLQLLAAAPSTDPEEQQLQVRAERLLATPQLAAELGFVQAWPSAGPQRLPGPAALGHALQLRDAHRISSRLRGLCLYLSRLLRPLWLAPVMAVAWPARASDTRPKRRRDEWWPPPPEPAPEVSGAQWRCAWSKAQRAHVQGQLARLGAALERLKGTLDSSGPEPTEVGLAGGLALLVATAMQALAFLELVPAEALARANCLPEVLVRFAELTFRDLVCLPQARKVLHQLMRGGVVACRQLHAKCPALFSAADLEVQEACELLTVVQGSLGGSALDVAQLSQLVHRALRTLERHAARVELAEAATRLRAVGAYKGLVSLCARVARARDPHDESVRSQDPGSARAQQLHYARLECYQVVLELLEELLARARAAGAATSATLTFAPAGTLAPAGTQPPAEVPELLPVPVAEADAAMLLDALLRHCLEGEAYLSDELLHFCLLKWSLQCGLPLYRYDSPYLKGFLERHARDQPELLCRYFQHRGRWAEACDAYMALARGRGPEGQPLGFEERSVLLQSAALCARMPGSNRPAEPIVRAMQELSAAGRPG